LFKSTKYSVKKVLFALSLVSVDSDVDVYLEMFQEQLYYSQSDMPNPKCCIPILIV